MLPEAKRVIEENDINKDRTLLTSDVIREFAVAVQMAKNGKIRSVVCPSLHDFNPGIFEVDRVRNAGNIPFAVLDSSDKIKFREKFQKYRCVVSAGDLHRFYRWYSDEIERKCPGIYICRVKKNIYMEEKPEYVYQWNTEVYNYGSSRLKTEFSDAKKLNELSDAELDVFGTWETEYANIGSHSVDSYWYKNYYPIRYY